MAKNGNPLRIAKVDARFRSGKLVGYDIHLTPAGKAVVGWLSTYTGERPMDWEDTIVGWLDKGYNPDGSEQDPRKG